MNKLSANAKNEIGNRYGRLTVIDFAGKANGGAIKWTCECDCGKTVDVAGYDLRRSQTTSCGCYRTELKKEAYGPNFVDETGNRYGKLVVIEKIKSNGRSKGARWLCKCDCGETTIVTGGNLRQQGTISCGCHLKALVDWKQSRGYFNELYKRFKNSAKKRNYEWSLTKEEVEELIVQDCFYCGDEPRQVLYKTEKYQAMFRYNGLDRVDNFRGYVSGNVVPCCGKCNYAKREQSIDEFRDWIVRIYKNFAAENQ